MFSRLLLTTAIRVLETIFVLGILGSALVLILTLVDDVRDLFKRDVSQTGKN